MGRCYEFGVAVGQGCDHPMVVAADGSACACSECGTVCKGRFDGCAAVLARPGYSPVLAVAVAVTPAPVTPAPVPAAPVPAALAPAVDIPEGPAVPAVSDVPQPQPGAVVDSIEALRHDLETRDIALGEAFERLITSYDRLTGVVELLGERLAELEGRDPAPLFPFRRDA